MFAFRDVPRLAGAFFRLPGSDRWLALRCVLLLPAVGVALRVIRMPRLQPLLNRYAISEFDIADAVAVQRGRQVASIVRSVARQGFYPAKCLEQSLAVWYLLRRERIPVDICIGVRMPKQVLEAHAWVEYRGTVLEDSDSLVPQFARFKEPLVSAQSRKRAAQAGES